MHRSQVDLYVDCILDFSSQYGSEIGSTYKINKLIGNYSIYPQYGDFSDAAFFRTYGNSWKNCPSALKDIKSIAISDYSSEDYFEFSIKFPLIVSTIQIYETYNPGSVEIIYFLLQTGWTLMWQREPGERRKVPKESRIFSPNIEETSCPCNKFRVEVNQSICDYYSEFDAIKVSGYRASKNDLIDHDNLSIHQQPYLTANHNQAQTTSDNDYSQTSLSDSGPDYISHLPEEILIKIFSYFPLKTLSKISSVSRRFLSSADQAMRDFKEINFRRTWAKLDHASLIWIGTKCQNLRRVDLSWCGKNVNFTLFGLCHFLTMVGQNLVTLRLSTCATANDCVIRSIVINIPQLQELDLSSCVNITQNSFAELRDLRELRYLNLYRTKVNCQSIEMAAESWVKLQHLNLGSCINIERWNVVIKKLSTHCRDLKSIDLWRSGITNDALIDLAKNCTGLEELDLGWCLRILSERGCFDTIARNIPRLKKLFLTSNRSITDADITILAEMCPLLEQLDVLGAWRLTTDSVLTLLRRCSHLKMLDLSFCAGIDRRQILHWSTQYPACSILVSYQDKLCAKT